MEKGELIYPTPPNNIYAILFSCGLIVCGFILSSIILYGAMMNNLNLSELNIRKDNFIAYWLFACFYALVVGFGPILASTVILKPSFKIYKKGITSQIAPIYPFTKEGTFISYSEIKGFEVSHKGWTYILYLTPTNYVRFFDKRKEVITMLKKNLVEHGIKEMPMMKFPTICPTCRKKIHILYQLNKCPYCHHEFWTW